MVAAAASSTTRPRETPPTPVTPAERPAAKPAAAQPTPRAATTTPAAAGTPTATPDARTAADARLRNAHDPATLQARAALEGRVAPTPDQIAKGSGVMMRGQQGAPVSDLQTELNAGGTNPPLEVDGKFGPKTDAAVREFQGRNGLTVDGKVGTETLGAIRSPTADQFRTDARYQRLNDATKAQIDTRLGAVANDPVARQNVADLAKRDGFAQLNPTHQREMLDAQGRAPADPAVSRDLGALADSPQFRGLNDGVKSTAIAQIGNHPTDPGARRTISDLTTSPGFAGLPEAEQTRMLQYVGGTNDYLSDRARPEMDRLLRDPAYTSASPADQTARLRQFMTDQPGIVGVTNGLGHDFTAQRRPYTVSAPTAVDSHAFQSGAAPALRYDVTIDGRTVPVYMPATTDPANGAFHNIDEVARGLAALPAANLALINSVRVDPQRNPQDAHWATTYNDPNFRSYMTAGADGNVSIYPSATATPAQSVVDASFIHETGHVLSGQRWGADSDARWQPWQQAMASDGLRISNYAKNSQGEDFSETLTLYQMVRGTPQEAEMRALMPERFRILDEMLGTTR